MKQLLVILNLLIVLLSSCATQKMGTSSVNDDVYANPKEDRMEDARIAAEKKQVREAREKRYNDSIAAVKQAQKDKDDANPYYKDRDFKYDDYYDYEYATRVKRFNNNINGLGYYDNYYTNSYWYNQNPYNYGVSVYNGYSWWGSSYNNYSYNPSISFYSNYGWGNNYGYGGYNGYNPYDPYASAYWQGYNNGYSHGYNNGWGGYPYYGFGYGGYGGYGNYGYGYNPYGYGYGYGGGYGYAYPSNGWGYYNGYDNNSGYTYGARASHTGANSQRTSNPGVTASSGDTYSQKFINSVAEKQAIAPKFNDVPTVKYNNPVRDNGNYNSTPVRGYQNENVPIKGYDNSNNGGGVRTPVRNYDNQTTTPTKQYDNQPIKQYDSQPVRQYDSQPTKQYESQPVKQYESQPVRQYESQPARENNNLQSFPSNNGGGGGGGRPSGGNVGGGRPR